MKKNAIAVPTTSFQFLEPIHAKPQIIIMIIGQGELINNFSNLTKKKNNGSKKASILSPYALENFLKANQYFFLTQQELIFPLQEI